MLSRRIIFSARGKKSFTLRKMDQMMTRYHMHHLDRELFFDGDRFALCTIIEKNQKN
ncbi:MAG: hypothetical protein ACYCPR_05190 [Thermoplasmataceae archaeon]|nr:hypothetical protein [Candidatus Thermoplasmatota archaeon]